MEKKEKYEVPEIEVTRFGKKDVIVTSDPYEGPKDPAF